MQVDAGTEFCHVVGCADGVVRSPRKKREQKSLREKSRIGQARAFAEEMKEGTVYQQIKGLDLSHGEEDCGLEKDRLFMIDVVGRDEAPMVFHHPGARKNSSLSLTQIQAGQRAGCRP